MPGEKTFVSWHQDGMYWNLKPDAVLTAGVAIGPSNTDNGCLRVDFYSNSKAAYKWVAS